MRQVEAAVDRSRDARYPHMQPPLGHFDLDLARVGARGRDADLVMSAVVHYWGVLETRRPPARQQKIVE